MSRRRWRETATLKQLTNAVWVSKQIIDKHKGTIRVRSSTKEPHRGTVFSVLLPENIASLSKSHTASSS